MVVLENKNNANNGPTPKDVIFVVEGTALCGAYLSELKQTYIIPTLEYFNGGPLDEKECESVSNYVIYGLVVFHSSDILPGYLTDAYGPITTPYRLLSTLEKIDFAGGHGEAASHVGEGLATALQCLEDINSIRSPALEIPAKKHVILICNCKPYGLPVTESVGTDGVYCGMTADQLAGQMKDIGVHLSVMSPRKIPALISLFEKAGGETSSQKTYAKDVRHLMLLNGYHLQERPVTPKQAPEIPIINLPPPSSTPSHPQAPVTTNQSLAPPLVPTSISQPQPQISTSMASQQQQNQQLQPPPQPVSAASGPSQSQVLPPSVSSQAPNMSTSSTIIPSSAQQTSIAMSTAAAVSMSQVQAGSTSINQPPNSTGMNLQPPQQPNQQQQMIFIRNRAPLQVQNIRQMQMQNQQMSQNQPMNPNQMSQSVEQSQMNSAGGPLPGQQMMNSQQIHPNQQQMNMNQQQHQMNPQLSQQLQNQQLNLNQPINSQQQVGQQFSNQQIAQQMNHQQLNQPGQPQTSVSIPGPRLSNVQISQQHQLQSQVNQPTSQLGPGRWPNQQQMPTGTPMQRLQQAQGQGPILRVSNVNQPQVPTSVQPLQAQMSTQQPILSTGIQPSPLQQQLQQNQQQQQQPVHSTLLQQLKNPPQMGGAPQQPVLPGQLLTNQKERVTIWNGTLEWHEKQKGPSDGQKVPRQVPCKVAANVNNGEPEVKGDGWPSKLIMQLIPKNIVGSLGGSFLVRDVKTVVFLLQNCEALNSLTRVMESGYAGCVHFTGAGMQQAACNIKVLILLYSKERQTYLGFIPNDQVGFVDRIRKVIQQQKQQQQTTRQVFPGPGGMTPAGLMQGQQGPGVHQVQQQGITQSPAGMLQGPSQQQVMVQQPGMVQAQQTPISSLTQQIGQTTLGSMGQSPVVSVLAQQLGQAQQLQQQIQQQQQQIQNTAMGGGNMNSQNQPDLNQLEMERQQNLLTIQQLQQTLQAAQQKELQFQQLQHHPTTGPGGTGQQQQPGPNPMQVQVSQQQLMQGGPVQQPQIQQVPRQMMTSNPQAMGQMRLMRASVSQTNPGLKHLLQQQPGPQMQQYRMQMSMQQQQQQHRMQGQMAMSGQMQGQHGGPMQPNQQSQFEDVGILDLLK